MGVPDGISDSSQIPMCMRNPTTVYCLKRLVVSLLGHSGLINVTSYRVMYILLESAMSVRSSSSVCLSVCHPLDMHVHVHVHVWR